MSDKNKPFGQDELDQKVADAGKLRTIDNLDPINEKLDESNLTKFLNYFDHTYMDRSKPKGPDYLIIDNFVDYFGIDYTDLFRAKGLAEVISNAACS